MGKHLYQKTLQELLLWACTVFLPRFAGVQALSSVPPTQNRRQESLHVGNNPLLSLNINLDALSRQGATDRAQELYSRIFALYEEGYYATAPDIVSFNTVLKGFQEDPAGAMAFWEQEISTPSSDAPPRLEPNTRSYNTILLALARSGLHTECLAILRLMQNETTAVVPDRITYNTVLHSYASSLDDEAPVLAEHLLEEMIQSSEEQCERTGMRQGVAPDVISYNTVLTCWAQRGQAEKAQVWLDRLRNEAHLRADVYSYTILMQAWAEQGGVDQALQLLADMQSQPSAHAFPNKITYTALVNALCQKGRMEEANDVVRQMWKSAYETQPDVVTYSALLEGWARVAQKRPFDAMNAVGNILREMQQRSNRGVAPNDVTYTLALKVLAKTGKTHAASRAHELVESMENPKLFHYNSLLNVYSKSDRKDKISCCIKVWNDMKKTGGSISPDRMTYNTLLSTLSTASGDVNWKHRCLTDGLKCYEEFETVAQNNMKISQPNEKALPTSLTYSFLIRLVRRCGVQLSSEDRQAWFRHILQACGPRYGCLNPPVWKQLMDACSPLAARQQMSVMDYLGLGETLGDDTAGLQDAGFAELPPHWTRRGMPDKRRRSAKN